MLLTCENLPRKFRHANPRIYDTSEVVVVDRDGALQVEQLAEGDAVGSHGNGKRWSYLSWTEEQGVSCRPIRMKLRFWNEAMVMGR